MTSYGGVIIFLPPLLSSPLPLYSLSPFPSPPPPLLLLQFCSSIS